MIRRSFRNIVKRNTRRFESVRTDYEGGFTDTMKAVDAMLEKYTKIADDTFNSVLGRLK